MYKSLKLTKKLTIAFNSFPKTAKTVSKVYKSGVHKWIDSSDSTNNYSIVIGTFRVLVYIKNKDILRHSCN